MGSAATNVVVLPSRFPEQAGVFTLAGGEVSLLPEDRLPLRLNDMPLIGSSPTLNADTSGEPDYLFLEDARMMIIDRAGRLAVRIWDPQNKVRSNFGGCLWYPVDAKFRVTAQIRRFPEPKQVMIDDIVGIQRPGWLHAALSFELDGKQYTLEGEEQEDGNFDLIFKDSTASQDTYGAGRYLTTEPVHGDSVVIDFNMAYNPPCAFTAFATCPLPRPENVLPIAIKAGELFKG
jgi:hypothetical protein